MKNHARVGSRVGSIGERREQTTADDAKEAKRRERAEIRKATAEANAANERLTKGNSNSKTSTARQTSPLRVVSTSTDSMLAKYRRVFESGQKDERGAVTVRLQR